jgi:phosphate transport system substrate-binding protein
MIAAACGSDDDDTEAGSTETTEAAETETTEAAETETTEAMEEGDGEMAEGDCGGNINVSGSSTVEPVSRKAAELYEDICPEAIITVDGPGTGDGFKLFCAGDTDVSDASRAIKDSEAEDCAANGIEYTELVVAYDGIAVMTNPNNTAVDCLSFPDLYALLGGESEGIDNWSDADPALPDAPLDISAPGTESGTYDSFIEIVLEGLAEEAQGEDAQFIRQDFSGNADDNVIIEGIAGSDSSLGWVGFAFADENSDRVKTLAVSEEAGGECIAPTIETIADGSYPVSRALYIYVNNEKIASNPALAGYIDFYLNAGYSESVTKAFGESGYVELPADQLQEVRDTWAAAHGG